MFSHDKSRIISLHIDLHKLSHETIQILSGSVTKPLDQIPENERMRQPAALNKQLLPHQLLGVMWMRQHEHMHKGGILADDMGLGKTIQIISLVLTAPRQPGIRESGGTLIIVPFNLLSQWEYELSNSVKYGHLKTFVYLTKHRFSSLKLFTRSRFDVVLTTYSTISSEYTFMNNTGSVSPLFQLTWNRLVLDEAQQIRNYRTLCSRACCDLKATYRWTLSGTPIQNNIKDLFSILFFLRIEPYCDWNRFKRLILLPLSKGTSIAAEKRIAAIISLTCLRRTKAMLIDGEPILNLPGISETIIQVQMSPKEKIIYNEMKMKSQNIFAAMQGNTKTMSHLLVLILRLRQFVLEPLLILRSGIVDDSDSSDHQRRIRQYQQLKETSYALYKKYLEANEEWYFDCPCGAYGKNFDDGQLMVACDECGVWQHCECNLEFNSGQSFLCEICMKRFDAEFQINSSFDGHETTKLGSKGQVAYETIQRILTDTDDDKVVVFSQFTSFLLLFSRHLKRAGIKHVLFHGEISNDDRRKNLKIFRQIYNCGAFGLNLTCANHVLIMDNWWNPAVEQQAVDRVNRYGQTKQVYVYKILVDESIEERIEELKQTKTKLLNLVNLKQGLSVSEMSNLLW